MAEPQTQVRCEDGWTLLQHLWTMYHHIHTSLTATDALRWVIHPAHRDALLRLRPEENPLGFFARTLAPEYHETIGGMPIRIDREALVPMLELR